MRNARRWLVVAVLIPILVWGCENNPQVVERKPPAMVNILVDTEPKGAFVFIKTGSMRIETEDGRGQLRSTWELLGTTPLNVSIDKNVRPGFWQLKIEKNGFKTRDFDVDNNIPTLKIELELQKE